MKYYNEEIETMNREQLKELQSKRLVDLVKRVYENVPYYRAKMDAIGLKPEDIKSIDDITKLPFTEKHDLRANYPFGLFATDKKNIVRIHASSGTTGKLTVVGYTQRDLDDWSECVARSLVMAGLDNNDILHNSYGYGLFTGGLGLHYGAEKLGVAVVPCSTGNTQRQLMLMNDFGATAMCCTPSYATYLAEEIPKLGYDINDFSLKVAILGAEPWTEEMRDRIEKDLHVKAFNIYGLSEISGPGVAMECEERAGSHVFEDLFYPEIVDTVTLEPVKDGEKGELVFTTLNKEGIPLIRYRTRDITSITHEKCKCGREFARISRLEGRSDDMLIIRGVNVFPSQIETVLLKLGEYIAPQYQVIVDRVGSLDVMEIQVELKEEMFSDEVKKIETIQKQLAADMQSSIGISAKITLVSPSSLPRTEGKAKRVIDLRKKEGILC